MAPLPQASPVVDLIYRWREKRAAETRQPKTRLGGSLIGHACDRHIWYALHHAIERKFDGRMLRLFETGELAEDRFVAELEAIGVTVSDRQKYVGTGLLGGFIDGIGLGVPGAEKTPHLLEFKTHNAKSFAKLLVEGIPPSHMAQVQYYMHFAGLKRALYLAVNKDTDELYAKRIEYDPAVALVLVAKAERIVAADAPPLAPYPATFYVCQYFCDYRDICHHKAVPERNCRTCVNGMLTPTGAHCENGHETPVDGCHRFNPALVPMSQTDYDMDRDAVIYDGWEDVGDGGW